MGFFKKTKERITEEEAQSVPMRLIIKLKHELNVLLIINLITVTALIISVADSIIVREQKWDKHTDQVEQIVEDYCGDAPWLN